MALLYRLEENVPGNPDWWNTCYFNPSSLFHNISGWWWPVIHGKIEMRMRCKVLVKWSVVKVPTSMLFSFPTTKKPSFTWRFCALFCCRSPEQPKQCTHGTLPFGRTHFHMFLCPATHRLSDRHPNEMPLLSAARCTAFISPARCLAKDGKLCAFKSCQMVGNRFEKPWSAVIAHQISGCELVCCWQVELESFPFLMSQTIRPFFEDIVLGVSSWRVLPQWRRWSPWELQQRSWAKPWGRMDIQLPIEVQQAPSKKTTADNWMCIDAYPIFLKWYVEWPWRFEKHKGFTVYIISMYTHIKSY